MHFEKIYLIDNLNQRFQFMSQGPGSVQDLKVVSLSGSSVVMVWRRPTPPSGRIGHYIIQVKDTVSQETVSSNLICLTITTLLQKLCWVLQKKFLYQGNELLSYQVGHLVENRLYEVSVTARGRLGESKSTRTLTVSPSSKSNLIQLFHHLF